MTLSNEIQKFLDSQIEYYIKEAESYKEMAREYNLDANSVPDTAFGIIIGLFTQVFCKHIQIKVVLQARKTLKNSLK